MGRSEAESEAMEAARRVAPVFSGPRLVALRELRGETQAAVAAAAGITASALSQAERGDTALSSANIAKVAQFFEVSPGAFAERREPGLEMKPQFRHLRRTFDTRTAQGRAVRPRHSAGREHPPRASRIPGAVLVHPPGQPRTANR